MTRIITSRNLHTMCGIPCTSPTHGTDARLHWKHSYRWGLCFDV